MNQTVIGYLIGGIVPAILYGLYNILQKASSQYKISPGMYLIVVGICAITLGTAYCLIFKEYTITPTSGFFATLNGLMWGFATCLIALAYSRFKMPVSKLVPIFNTNTLVAVILGLIIFSEWKTVSSPKIIIGAILVIIGGTLATNA
jgi:glucose uptake protein GlcU